MFIFSVMMDDVQAQQEYDEFFEEIFVELEDKVSMVIWHHVRRISLVFVWKKFGVLIFDQRRFVFVMLKAW